MPKITSLPIYWTQGSLTGQGKETNGTAWWSTGSPPTDEWSSFFSERFGVIAYFYDCASNGSNNQ
eukprot:scaffold237298_cov35-Attheya_sp.AAC.1